MKSCTGGFEGLLRSKVVSDGCIRGGPAKFDAIRFVRSRDLGTIYIPTYCK